MFTLGYEGMQLSVMAALPPGQGADMKKGMSVTIHNGMQGHPMGLSQESMGIASSPRPPGERQSSTK